MQLHLNAVTFRILSRSVSTPWGNSTATQLTPISHVLCPYVQRAVIALTEKRVPFERIDVDLANKPQWFIAISPLGKTPVLKVRETAIFESAVILEFLEDTQPLPLHPSQPVAPRRTSLLDRVRLRRA